ncbi:MAG: hypothetical protein ACK5X3_23065 [Pseudomonadota bacterium]|jgi:hypothetical protein
MSRPLAYYNEIDDAAAHVLRHLIDAGTITYLMRDGTTFIDGGE